MDASAKGLTGPGYDGHAFWDTETLVLPMLTDTRPELARDAREIAAWREAAQRMYVPYDERLGVHPQDQDFTTHEHWDFDATPCGAMRSPRRRSGATSSTTRR